MSEASWRRGLRAVADRGLLFELFRPGQVEVKDNDVIRVGRTRFVVRLLDNDKISALWTLQARGA